MLTTETARPQELHLAWQAHDAKGCKASHARTFCWRCGWSTRSASFAQVLETTCPSTGAPTRGAAARAPLPAWLGKKLHFRGEAASSGAEGPAPISTSCCSAVAKGERGTIVRWLGCDEAPPAPHRVFRAGPIQMCFMHFTMAAIKRSQRTVLRESLLNTDVNKNLIATC